LSDLYLLIKKTNITLVMPHHSYFHIQHCTFEKLSLHRSLTKAHGYAHYETKSAEQS
jgi:hypothetical protein